MRVRAENQPPDKTDAKAGCADVPRDWRELYAVACKSKNDPQKPGETAERAGFESDKLRREGSSRVAKGTHGQAVQANRGDPSRPPQPKPQESNEAVVAAIKVALDEGRHERAAALLEVLRRTEGSGRVVPLLSVRSALTHRRK